MDESPDDRYTAVVFTSRQRTGETADPEGYAAMAARMEELAAQQPGFRGITSVHDADGLGITVSYFDSDDAARAWKRHPEHLEAQRLGRERWYEWYDLRVTTVEREYRWQRAGRMFHIALPADWASAQRAGVYTTSTRGVSLADEGFIHCSFDHQVERTANAYYADLDELILLRIDPDRLGSPVVVEPPFPGAADDYPHVYGPIPVDAVIEVSPWHRDAAGWSRPAAG